MNVRDMLIALVRGVLRGEAVDACALNESLSSEKMATLFKVAKKHDVAHLVCLGLESCGIALSGEVGQLFLKEKEQAHLRYEMMQADIQGICACFEEEGIDHVMLKGAVVRQYYPEAWMRTSCDVDILVKEEALEAAVDALVNQCGYKVDGKKAYHDISLYSPFGMHLELHHNIKENEPKFDELLTQVWAFCQKEQGYEHRFSQSLEFLLFHLTAHAAYHFVGGGCGLRSVLDIWLLSGCLHYDGDKLHALLTQAGLSTFYSVLLSLGEYWFGSAKEADKIVKDTELYILLGGVYGTAKQGAVAKQVKKGGKARYFLSRIFLPYESLAVLYPVIKKHKILTPFCQVARWFGALFKGKRIKKEIKNVTSASREQTSQIRELMSALGL